MGISDKFFRIKNGVSTGDLVILDGPAKVAGYSYFVVGGGQPTLSDISVSVDLQNWDVCHSTAGGRVFVSYTFCQARSLLPV